MRLRRKIFKREWYVLLIVLLFTSQTFGQEDSSNVLSTVDVHRLKNDEFRISDIHTAAPSYTISEHTIAELGSRDVGEALKFIPGIQIKDYGGIGGIKSISYRSLGSAHTLLLLDGNPQINTQTGAINLSRFESFGISAINFSTGQPNSISAMPSAYLPAQSIHIRSNLMKKDTCLNYEVLQNMTTVNSYESGLRINVPLKKGFIGTQLFAKYGSGQYKYHYDLAGTTQEFTRINSDILNYKARIAGGYSWRGKTLEGIFYYNNNDQKLPGAVILYNPSNDQMIRNIDYRGDINFTIYRRGLFTKLNAFGQSNYTKYEDPSFLNSQGFWKSEYHQENYGAGVISNFFFQRFYGKLTFGSDFYYSALTSNEFSNSPLRTGANSVVSFEMKFPKFLLETNLAHQVIYDQARSADSISTQLYSKFSPYMGFRFYPFDKKWLSIRGFYKHVFRMPGFNDLYYNFIGNTNLLPEDAHLINFGIGHEFVLKADATVELGLDGFYNLVKNKIVAIPTKDIFNWSMQNIGRTRATGFDASLLYAQKERDWNWAASATYTLNFAVDITDSSGSAYGHQIPYTPISAANACFAFGWKGFNLSNNVIFTGERYSLNENIPINHLDPFMDWNIGLSKEFEFAAAHKLFVSAKIMNVLGNNYEVVRSFPMPGRYYQFTLKFKYK